MRTLTRRGFFTLLAGLSGAAVAAPSLTPAAATAEAPVTALTPVAGEWIHLQEAGLDIRTVAGTVKWFDVAKGYGFVTPDDGGLDILLHVTCLRAGGYQTAFEGARLNCQVLRRPKGVQVFRILSMDDSTAIIPSLPPRTHAPVKAESDWERAIVKWFNGVRGFGFLTRGPAGPDIFVHLETVQHSGLTELRPGQMVQVRWGMGAKGRTAAQLRPDPSWTNSDSWL